MFGSMMSTKARKTRSLNDKKQFDIIEGKTYLYHRGFGGYVVRFDNDDVILSEEFFNENFVAPVKCDW